MTDEINVGVNAKWDVSVFQEIWPQLVYKPQGCDYSSMWWARADLTREVAMVGTSMTCKECDLVGSGEVMYGWGSGFKGIQGQPVKVRAGADWKLGCCSVNAHASWATTYALRVGSTHKINDNLSVSATQDFDAANCGKNQPAYHIGFGAVYKL